MRQPDWWQAMLGNLRRQPNRAIALQRYARLAGSYEDRTVGIQKVRRQAIDRLALQPGETVFDVACGAGGMLAELARRVGPQGRVIGIEQSPPMAELAASVAVGIPQVEVHAVPVENFLGPRSADALIFMFTHDVLQNPAALANVFAQSRPGARVVIAGLRLLPWWGWPINAWVVWGARNYLTTWHGLRSPWRPLYDWCPDLRVVQCFHGGTTYLAVGSVAPAHNHHPAGKQP